MTFYKHFTIQLLFSVLLLQACGNQRDYRIKTLYANDYVQCPACPGDNWQNSVLKDGNLTIEFKDGGVALFSKQGERVILPQKGKTSYTVKEINQEFGKIAEEISGYLKYYAKSITQKKEKSREVYATSFRGAVKPLAPNNCVVVGPLITFSWNTAPGYEGPLHFKIFHLDGRVLYGDTLFSTSLDGIELNADSIGLSHGGHYRWAINLIGTTTGDGLEFNVADTTLFRKMKDLDRVFKDYPGPVVNRVKQAWSNTFDLCK